MTHAILAVALLLLSTACGVKGPPVRSVDASPVEAAEGQPEPEQEEEDE